MEQMPVITVDWVSETEVHIYVPDEGGWWARPVPNLRGGDDVWELNVTGDDDEEPPSYHESADAIVERIGEQFDMPVVVRKDHR